MSENNTTVQLINEAVTAWIAEDAKFESGNSAAGTRARKALGDIGKLVKIRRGEITDIKNNRKLKKE